MLKNIMNGLLILVALFIALVVGTQLGHDDTAPQRTSSCSTGWLAGETPETVTVTCTEDVYDPVTKKSFEVSRTETVMSYEQFKREGLRSR